jgi:hypothetical protein
MRPRGDDRAGILTVVQQKLGRAFATMTTATQRSKRAGFCVTVCPQHVPNGG